MLRLVGRRHDAPLVFADAGRRAARYAARSGARPARTLARMSPSGVGRRIALGAAARLARDIFGGELSARSQGSEVSMRDPLSILAIPDGAACAFYGSVYGELLRSLTAFEGAMLHEECRVARRRGVRVAKRSGGGVRVGLYLRPTVIPVNIASVEFLSHSVVIKSIWSGHAHHSRGKIPRLASAAYSAKSECRHHSVSIGNCSGFRELRRGTRRTCRARGVCLTQVFAHSILVSRDRAAVVASDVALSITLPKPTQVSIPQQGHPEFGPSCLGESCVLPRSKSAVTAGSRLWRTYP